MRTWEDRHARGEKIGRKVVEELFGGKFPHAEGFDWTCISHFRQLTPGILQGFTSDGEPMAPALGFSISGRALSINEVFASAE